MAGVSPVVPAEKDKTPVLPMVTLPVALDTEMPEPARLDKTPVLATVIVPKPLVTDMPEPKPSVLRVYPVPLPINNCPLVGIVVNPVPPDVTAKAVPMFMLINEGLINQSNQACEGRPVVGSRNAEYGMLMLEFGIVVAINFPLRLPSTQRKQ